MTLVHTCERDEAAGNNTADKIIIIYNNTIYKTEEHGSLTMIITPTSQTKASKRNMSC